MFAKKSIALPPNKINSVIGQGIIFKGSIQGEGYVRIDGEFEGVLSNNGDVMIEQSGRVNAELKAQKITIAGNYEGNLEAEKILEIKKTGIAHGTFTTRSLVVEEGARLTGIIDMKVDALTVSDKVKPQIVRGGTTEQKDAPEAEETKEDSMKGPG